jgi:ketosteroid isomerase-like protein
MMLYWQVRLWDNLDMPYHHQTEGNVMRRIILAAALVGSVAMGAVMSARAAEVTQQELMQAAEMLGKGYDDNYNAKNAAGMAALYSSDGVLVSPAAVIRGTGDLKSYYQSRFDAGAGNHATKIAEVHVQGDGGFGIGQVSATVPMPDGGLRDIKGNLVTVYEHGANGWHLRLVIASVAPSPPPK